MRRILSFLLVLVVIGGGVFVWGYAQYVRPGPLAVETAVVIPRGAGVEGIAGALVHGGVIASPLIFRLGVRVTRADKNLRAGEYAFPARTSPRDVVRLLESGRTVVRRLTLAEGLTTAQVLAQLALTDGLEGGTAPAPGAPAIGEGSILPETYHFSYGDGRTALLARMQQAMTETLAGLWAGRAAGLALKSPRDALILASIVEKETARPEERARIAAVFFNRLGRGMRLQSDPTVVYGLTAGAGPLGRPLTRADLRAPSPYNTYVIRGLPPGPICNPGRAAIMAVLHPADTDELYFVADGNGGHVFARTLKEHNHNVARWRKMRDGRAP